MISPVHLEAFCTALPPDVKKGLATLSHFEEKLAGLYESARAAHPDFEVPPGEFLPYVAARLSSTSQTSPEAQLSELRAADLYLACACLRNKAAALTALKELCRLEARTALQRISVPLFSAEDVQQEILVRLLAHDAAGTPPKLAQYAGTGSLRAWVRIVAAREVLMLLRKTRQQPTDKLGEIFTERTSTPELDYLKQRYRREFQEALAAALQQLSPRQRNLLRYHLIHRFSIDDIAGLYHISRATAARWLEKSRSELFTATRDRMMKELRVPAAGFDSILRLIHSELDISVKGMLQGIDDPEEACAPQARAGRQES